MELAHIFGQTEESMKARGRTTTCMDKESIAGLMVESTSEHMRKIKSTGKVNSSGKMVDSMKAAGSMANSQEQASIPMFLEKGEKEYGQMESGKSGSMDSNTMDQRLESILFQMDQLTRVN